MSRLSPPAGYDVMRHQADVRFGHQRWHERLLYEVQLTSGCD